MSLHFRSSIGAPHLAHVRITVPGSASGRASTARSVRDSRPAGVSDEYVSGKPFEPAESARIDTEFPPGGSVMQVRLVSCSMGPPHGTLGQASGGSPGRSGVLVGRDLVDRGP